MFKVSIVDPESTGVITEAFRAILPTFSVWVLLRSIRNGLFRV